MRIVVLNGRACVGKDLFVTLCASCLGADKVKNYSTVDYVKAVAAFIGWDGTKDDKSRKFLSDLKDALTEWDDIPYRRTKIEIENFQEKMNKLGGKYAENGVMFIHCREPKEIQRLKEEFGATTLLIRRDAAEGANWQNHADQNVLDYEYDYVILNNGTLSELRANAEMFLCEELGLNI